MTKPEQAELPAGWNTWPSRHPPFRPGNRVAEVHGAWSDRVLAPVAREILQSVLDDPACSYLQAPRFAAELQAWSVAEARVRLLERYIAKLAEGDDTGVGDLADERTRAAWSLLHRCEARAMSGRDRLGLSPAAAARLGRDVAQAGVDIAAVMAQLEKAAKAREGGDGD